MRINKPFTVLTVLVIAAALACASRSAANNGAAEAPATSASSSVENRPAVEPSDRQTEPDPLPTPDKVVQINKDPVTLAKSFYEFYLDGYPTMSGNEVTFAQFLTPRFYDEAERNDLYDPFLDTQDGDDPTWKRKIRISNVVTKGDRSTLIVLLDGKKKKWKAKLTLVKKAGTWKIDGIYMSVN